MTDFKHPTSNVELEGVYIIKNSLDKFVFLSDNMDPFKRVVLTKHDDIVKHLAQFDVTIEDLEFSEVGSFMTAWLDA